jgi:CxxC motif-containing protein (DUF1111 family)
MTAARRRSTGQWRRRFGFAALLVVATACSSGGGEAADPAIGQARSGGRATVFDTTANAFATALPSLTTTERRAFSVGNSFFNDNWVTAPASTTGRDGLGPLFNAQSCSSCHLRDGRGAPPQDIDDPARGLLFRLSVPGRGPHDGVLPEPTYGDQLQDRAILGVPPEGRVRITLKEVPGRYADGTRYTLLAPTYEIVDLSGGPIAPDVLVSPRIAPSVFGVGLVEAIPEQEIVARADPDDADEDGISGRANAVLDVAEQHVELGRFGWKANVPTVEQQNASAFTGDIGITNRLFPEQPCTRAEPECLAKPHGGEPELDDLKLSRVTFYTRTLAVPARRDVRNDEVRQGEQLFRTAGCASCHVPTQHTGDDAEVPALRRQTIHPFTDLLLHDMGPGLADGRPDNLASGSEWRTPPLWGIGLQSTVAGHTRFLHDGRARNLEEAILWHGGEAKAAQRAFVEMPRVDRAALLAYLRSL